jgi:FkbM family methyltransferase
MQVPNALKSWRRLFAGVLRRAILPLLPGWQRLPFRFWLDKFVGACEPELICLDRFVPAGGIAVDVGANAGMYAYRLSRRCAAVYAFEVNDELTADLAAYNRGNITIIHEGLSSKTGAATLYIPHKQGQALLGWASLAPGNCPDTDQHEEKAVTVRPLDSFNLTGVSFVKIDVEGHEVEVLKGGRGTLSRDRPCVLVEVQSQNRAEVSAFFTALEYSEHTLQDLAGVPGSEENRLFLPREIAAPARHSEDLRPTGHAHEEPV